MASLKKLKEVQRRKDEESMRIARCRTFWASNEKKKPLKRYPPLQNMRLRDV